MKHIKIFLNVLPFIIIGVLIFQYVSNGKSSTQSLQTVSQTVGSAYPSSTPVPSGTYTLIDIAKHNNENDCWMVIEGKVYDVTTYINQHPDGRSILKGCGIDATQMFNEVRKHDPRGVVLLPEYLIGKIM